MASDDPKAVPSLESYRFIRAIPLRLLTTPSQVPAKSVPSGDRQSYAIIATLSMGSHIRAIKDLLGSNLIIFFLMIGLALLWCREALVSNGVWRQTRKDSLDRIDDVD